MYLFACRDLLSAASSNSPLWGVFNPQLKASHPNLIDWPMKGRRIMSGCFWKRKIVGGRLGEVQKSMQCVAYSESMYIYTRVLFTVISMRNCVSLQTQTLNIWLRWAPVTNAKCSPKKRNRNRSPTTTTSRAKAGPIKRTMRAKKVIPRPKMKMKKLMPLKGDATPI